MTRKQTPKRSPAEQQRSATPLPPPPPGVEWLTKLDLAGYLRLRSVRRVDELRKDPTFPEPRLLSGGTPRWSRREVDAYLESRPRGWCTTGGLRPGAFGGRLDGSAA
jgi:hypothetical protein